MWVIDSGDPDFDRFGAGDGGGGNRVSADPVIPGASPGSSSGLCYCRPGGAPRAGRGCPPPPIHQSLCNACRLDCASGCVWPRPSLPAHAGGGRSGCRPWAARPAWARRFVDDHAVRARARATGPPSTPAPCSSVTTLCAGRACAPRDPLRAPFPPGRHRARRNLGQGLEWPRHRRRPQRPRGGRRCPAALAGRWGYPQAATAALLCA